MDIENISFLTFLTITLITEAIFLFSFRFTKLPFTGKAINKWYDTFDWVAIIMDILSVLIGFYLSKYLYKYLKRKNILNHKEKYNLFYFLLVILFVQISHDFLFYFLVIRNTKKNENKLMDEFKYYADKVSYGAVIGDSAMYITAIIILYLIQNIDDELKIFLSLFCSYIMGYFIYQKPL